jgi:hypothetical protein
MSTELRVLVAHLGELAAKQREAAAVIASATDAVHGTGASVAATHGAISSSTAAAVGEAEDARRTAGGQVQRETRKMQQRLAESAQHYTVTDQLLGGALGIEMHWK